MLKIIKKKLLRVTWTWLDPHMGFAPFNSSLLVISVTKFQSAQEHLIGTWRTLPLKTIC